MDFYGFLRMENRMDFRHQGARFPAIQSMKNDTTTTALNVVLGALALAGVLFALLTIFRTRELRALQIQAQQAQASLVQVQAIANDALAFSQSHPSPELTRILQAAQAKPAGK